jgi:hypothetical protein
MRSTSVAFAALFGVAAANPAVWPRNDGYGYNPYPTAESSSSVASSYSSETLYPPASSSTYVQSSASSEYPYPPLSTDVSSDYPQPPSGTGYPPQPPYTGTGYPPQPPHPTGTGYISKPPMSTGYPGTEVLTTYTTTTVCPVTQTYGTEVITTITTSTITVTSCKAGCHHQPTPPASSPVHPTEGPVTETQTITATTYTFVPCSTSIGHNGPAVIYSTYLTASYYPTTYYTTKVIYPTPAPQPPVETSKPQPPVVTPAGNCPAASTVTVTIAPPAVTPVDNCPAASTITVTIVPPPPAGYETKTYTVTEHGYPTTITVTVPVTETPIQTPQSTPYQPQPPLSTGGSASSGIPQPTGHGPYPTGGHSSVIYSESHVGPKSTGYPYGYAW